jgi:hypothetical protein
MSYICKPIIILFKLIKMRSGKYDPKKGEKGRIKFLTIVRKRTKKFAQSNEVFRGTRDGKSTTLANECGITKEHGLGICIDAGLLIVDKTRKGPNGSVYVKWNRPLKEEIQHAHSTYMISYNTRVAPRKPKSVAKLKAERLGKEVTEPIVAIPVAEEQPKTSFPSSIVVTKDNGIMSDFSPLDQLSTLSTRELSELTYKLLYEETKKNRTAEIEKSKVESERSKNKHEGFLLLEKIIRNNIIGE